MTHWPETHWASVEADAFGDAVDLCEVIAWLSREGAPYECWRVQWGAAEPLLILFVPGLRRAGVTWGDAHAEWTNCDSAEDALRRYLAGETIP